jgi:hypothetical protein
MLLRWRFRLLCIVGSAVVEALGSATQRCRIRLLLHRQSARDRSESALDVRLTGVEPARVVKELLA